MARRMLLVLALALTLPACTLGYSSSDDGTLSTEAFRDDRGQFLGAGASFPAMLYQAWFEQYHQDVASGVKINYQSLGSGAGIQQFIEGVVDFGATDAPMSDEDMARAPDVQHLPTVIGAVVLAYNLPELDAPLRLNGDVVSRIYLGEITRWDDPAVAALNPGAPLPGEPISVVSRSDGSGTSFVFTDWLSKTSTEWAQRVGRSKNPAWPVGLGGKGNEGVTQLVRQTPGAIGYLELNYAASAGLPFAEVANRSGAFLRPTLETVAAAAEGVDLPPDFRVSITDTPAPNGYPISSFTFLLVDGSPGNCEKARVLTHTIWWSYHDPTALDTARELLYAPLPESALRQVDETLFAMTCANGEPVLPR
ncbi:MAG: phosphate ABC transporter substrate-binding protein PstS [Hyphomicrobiales bacterium]